jgi:hypothetical protein
MTQWPVLIFIGMMGLFGIGLIYATIAEELRERREQAGG